MINLRILDQIDKWVWIGPYFWVIFIRVPCHCTFQWVLVMIFTLNYMHQWKEDDCLVSENITGYIKNHWIKHKLVCTHFDPFSILIPNMSSLFDKMKFLTTFFGKKVEIALDNRVEEWSIAKHWTCDKTRGYSNIMQEYVIHLTVELTQICKCLSCSYIIRHIRARAVKSIPCIFYLNVRVKNSELSKNNHFYGNMLNFIIHVPFSRAKFKSLYVSCCASNVEIVTDIMLIMIFMIVGIIYLNS